CSDKASPAGGRESRSCSSQTDLRSCSRRRPEATPLLGAKAESRLARPELLQISCFDFSYCLFPFLFWPFLIWVFTEVLQEILRDITRKVWICFTGRRIARIKRIRIWFKGPLLRIGNEYRQAFAVTSCTMGCSLANSLSNMDVHCVLAHAIAH